MARLSPSSGGENVTQMLKQFDLPWQDLKHEIFASIFGKRSNKSWFLLWEIPGPEYRFNKHIF